MTEPDYTITVPTISASAAARVVLKFNPSGNPVVTSIKTLTAALITILEQEAHDNQDAARAAAVAATNYETACMWAVKAATMDKPAPVS